MFTAVFVDRDRQGRQRGITLGTVDLIVGACCIETGASLLTANHDFVPMRDHLGLRVTEL